MADPQTDPVREAELQVLDVATQIARFSRTGSAPVRDVEALREAVKGLEFARTMVRLRADTSAREAGWPCLSCGRPAWMDSTGQRYFYCRAMVVNYRCDEPRGTL